MSKHTDVALWSIRKPAPPKHSAGWCVASIGTDWVDGRYPRTPGKHAKPFGKHRAMAPVAEATTANVTPLKKHRTQAPTGCQICDDLDVAA